MKKLNLFLDFDDTITDTLQLLVKILNKKFNQNYQPSDIYKWDITDCYADLTRDTLVEIFDSDYFWENLTFKKDAFNSLFTLQEYYNLYIVTKVAKHTMYKKFDWVIKNIMDKGIKVVFMPIDLGCSKSEIDMSGGIMVDDNELFLSETNASHKILFENLPNREWNKNWTGDKVHNWNELYIKLRVMSKNE